MSHGLERPPEECPNGGVCLEIPPRILRLEEAHARNDASIRAIQASLESVKRDTHEMRVTLRERDRNWTWVQSAFGALLVFAVVQIGTTIWFASQISAQVGQHERVIADHEERLRFHSNTLGRSNP
jgi:hypothetical protein